MPTRCKSCGRKYASYVMVCQCGEVLDTTGKLDPSKMSVADMLAAARGEKSGGSAGPAAGARAHSPDRLGHYKSKKQQRMPYFVKRNEKVSGPFTGTQIKSAAKSGKLKEADLISGSKDGPWKALAQALGSKVASDIPQVALLNCLGCGSQVSQFAASCVHCGFRPEEKLCQRCRSRVPVKECPDCRGDGIVFDWGQRETLGVTETDPGGDRWSEFRSTCFFVMFVFLPLFMGVGYLLYSDLNKWFGPVLLAFLTLVAIGAIAGRGGR